MIPHVADDFDIRNHSSIKICPEEELYGVNNSISHQLKFIRANSWHDSLSTLVSNKISFSKQNNILLMDMVNITGGKIRLFSLKLNPPNTHKAKQKYS